MADTIKVIRIDLSDNWGWVKDGKAYRFDGQLLGDVIDLTERRRVVAGQDDDGSLNGNDYPETRLETEWRTVPDAAR